MSSTHLRVHNFTNCPSTPPPSTSIPFASTSPNFTVQLNVLILKQSAYRPLAERSQSPTKFVILVWWKRHVLCRAPNASEALRTAGRTMLPLQSFWEVSSNPRFFPPPHSRPSTVRSHHPIPDPIPFRIRIPPRRVPLSAQSNIPE